MYTPARWVVIDIDNGTPNKHQRVFAGWYGGYLNGDSWKMNSGITKIDEHEEFYEFHGMSGSIYRCYKRCYGMSGYMSSVLANIQENIEATITLVEGYDETQLPGKGSTHKSSLEDACS